MSEQDHAVKDFLQLFVTEQVEEEAAASEGVEEINLVGDAAGGLLMLDNELGKRAFTPPTVPTKGGESSMASLKVQLLGV